MNRAMRNIALGGSLALGLLAGCGTGSHQTADAYPQDRPADAHGHPPVAEPPHARSPAQYHDDAAISGRVQAAVLGVPGIHAQNLRISTYDGVVTLRGTAVDAVAARNAVQAARQVMGVRSVDYDMQVRTY